MVRSLAEFGESFVQGPLVLKRFPTLNQIAEIEERELRERGFGYRARTIPSIARQVLSRGGQAWLAQLRAAPYADAVRSLEELDGVGPKLADCICLFALHHKSAVPIDTHIYQAAQRLYFPQYRGMPLTLRRYREIGEYLRSKFGNLAGWAQQYLFYDNLLRSKKQLIKG